MPIAGPSRVHMQSHLYRPSFCKSRAQETGADDDELEGLPDLSVAFRLHLECGRLINLHDWLMAFASVVDPESEESQPSKQNQARFARAVAELQFLGFVKGTRRKADHVERLTWWRA
ncbi:hypothetical protein PTSG_06727 [Salpingoeca rosetta]|uniref:Origin recognition complex subunit 3 winged helix C-terminal domain-containing protein n=1 Tax=Salpingoeca rosetta (strain ATCC 50818 / BSB-021) TaxID=946362 RepID=F2UEM0_SALR5|nr:uncharacterized protein PTSG_06727 [Salpingoeca rosetta]EGD75070.1 hypothetical protein PTSG_06727 [Salpingoeca rosetta]|eukprot:XP_004992123.1 hypothetical protein PTSG_06727 [Salpingoeca rosetta]